MKWFVMCFVFFQVLVLSVGCHSGGFTSESLSEKSQPAIGEENYVEESFSDEAASQDIEELNSGTTESQSDEPEPSSSEIITATDRPVSEIWVTNDYSCVFQKDIYQEFKLVRNGDTLKAFKLSGTSCLGPGELSWQINVEGNIGSGFMNSKLPWAKTPIKKDISVQLTEYEIIVFDEDKQLVFTQARRK